MCALRDVAATARQACRLAAAVGYPVRLELVAPDAGEPRIADKLGCADDVRRAFDAVVVDAYRRAPSAHVMGVRVRADASVSR